MTKFTYTESIPERLYVACSGGVDSVATAAILSEWRDVTLLHYSHNDHAYQHELDVVRELALKLNVELLTAKQSEEVACNREACWREARYRWFHSFDGDVATGHTLDDAVEWYLMTCLRGRGEYMPHRRKNVFRPFLLTDKDELVKYCEHRGLRWYEDPGNFDSEFSLRSRVRGSLVPIALQCESGLDRMVRRRLVEKIASSKKKV